MTRIQFVLLLLAAFLGGLTGSRIFTPAPAQAQSGRIKVLEAEEVRLIERDGRPAARLQVDKSGRPGLFLYDSHGEVRAVLGVLPSGAPHLALSDRRGRVRGTFAVLSDETVTLFMSDEAGNRSVEVRVPAGENPKITLQTRDGKPLFTAP